MKKGLILGLLLAAMFLWTGGSASAESKGSIKLGVPAEPSTFDPHRITGFTMNMHFPLVFDNLVFRDNSGKIIPKLAKSWKLVKPTVLQFKLREGLKFTNGEPVDAHAVKFSLERILDPKLKSRQYGYFRGMDHVEVVDKYTVNVHTKYPDMFLLSPLTSYGNIVPPKYYKSKPLKYLARHPVGSGPYKLVKWSKGEEMVYEANPNYWDPSKNQIKKGTFKIIPEPTTRVSALLAGDVDIVYSVSPQLTQMVSSRPKVEVVAGDSVRTCYIILTIKKDSPWADVRVRKALNLAIDKKSIIKNVLQGNARIVATNVGPTSFGHNPNLKPFPYDPVKAKKLLAEAGYPNGFSVDMYVPLGRYLMGKQTAEAIAGQFAKVGIKARVGTPEWGKLVKIMRPRWEAHSKPFWWYGCRMDMHLHAEGMFAGTIHSKSTWGGFRDKGVDKLTTDARSEPDDAKRQKKYENILKILRHDKVPLVFLWQNNQIHAKKKSVNWKLRPNAVMLLSEMSWKK
jgi:peptide/nickel transport system substrate-binding protein